MNFFETQLKLDWIFEPEENNFSRGRERKEKETEREEKEEKRETERKKKRKREILESNYVSLYILLSTL